LLLAYGVLGPSMDLVSILVKMTRPLPNIQ
jgi:hypothetical protein